MKVFAFIIVVLTYVLWHPVSAADRTTSTIMSFDTGDALRWGSLSVHQPSSGFYGQRFFFDEDSALVSISIYIVDHSDFTETEATINFGIWQFQDRPDEELFVSESQRVRQSEVGTWKTFRFSEPFVLPAGPYVIGVGQTEAQAPIAFGNALACDRIVENAIWLLTPYKASDRESDNAGWREVTRGAEQCPTSIGSATLMMMIEVSRNQ